MELRRFTRSVALTALLATSVPLFAPLAYAQQPTAADKETARTLMQEGRKKRDKGDHAGALESFKAAHHLMKVPTTGLEVGREQIELGQLVEARDTLLDVGRMPTTAGEPAQFAIARKDALKLGDALAPRIPAIRFVITGLDTDENRTVTVDGVTVPAVTLSAPRKVNPGTHHVVVTARATERAVDVQVAEGATIEANIDFTGVPKPAKPEPVVATKTEPTPPPTTVAPVVKDPAPTVAPSTGVSPLVWIGFGVAVVGAISGTVTGVAHISNASRLEQKCPNNSCPSRYDADYDLTKTLGTVSTISFAVGGAGLILGVYGLVSRSSPSTEKPTAGLRVKPLVGIGSLGVVGEF